MKSDKLQDYNHKILNDKYKMQQAKKTQFSGLSYSVMTFKTEIYFEHKLFVSNRQF